MSINNRNRRIEVIISRLRIGHVGLDNYMNRFNMSDTDICMKCKIPETVQQKKEGICSRKNEIILKSTNYQYHYYQTVK